MMGGLAETEDLRRYKRIQPERKAVLSIGNEWIECTILDISGGGASIALDRITCEVPHVVLCDEQLGMIAATVERFLPGRLVLTFGIAGAEKERLIDNLTGLLNADLL